MASPDMPPPPQETLTSFTFKRLFTYDTDHPNHATLIASALAAKIPGLVGGDPSLSRLRLMTEAGQQPGAKISSSTIYYYEIIGERNKDLLLHQCCCEEETRGGWRF